MVAATICAFSNLFCVDCSARNFFEYSISAIRSVIDSSSTWEYSEYRSIPSSWTFMPVLIKSAIFSLEDAKFILFKLWLISRNRSILLRFFFNSFIAWSIRESIWTANSLVFLAFSVAIVSSRLADSQAEFACLTCSVNSLICSFPSLAVFSDKPLLRR